MSGKTNKIPLFSCWETIFIIVYFLFYLMRDLIAWTTKTLIVLWFWLWLEAHWLALFIRWVFALFTFSWLDIIYWYYLAHRRKIVTSSILSDGMMRKLFQIIVSTLRGIICYWIAHAINNESIDVLLSIFAIIPLCWFTYAQMSSLVENMWVWSKNDERRWIDILLKIFWIGKIRLEKKVEKYSDFIPQ